MLDTCTPLVPSPNLSVQTGPLYPYHYPVVVLKPTLSFPSPQPGASFPNSHSLPLIWSPRFLPPQNNFFFVPGWDFQVGLGLEMGLVRPEDTLPLKRSYRMGILFPSEKTLTFSTRETGREGPLSGNWGGRMLLNWRDPTVGLCKHPKAGPACCVPLLGQRKWNLTNKVKRAWENTKDGPSTKREGKKKHQQRV